jgi:cystathionine beta-lyase/cystathionine gamma-synthase
MDRHCASALQVAEWLHEQPWVQAVYYPGLLHHWSTT